MSALQGKRILLVEDEFIVATMAADMLTELGATVVGPAATLAQGLSLAERETLDAAVLDVNIDGERVDPVAAVLTARCIPMVLATGYGDAALGYAKEIPVLSKPYTQKKLGSALLRALTASR